jgi:hypothetical protein
MTLLFDLTRLVGFLRTGARSARKGKTVFNCGAAELERMLPPEGRCMAILKTPTKGPGRDNVKRTRIIVCGSRSFADYKLLQRTMDQLTDKMEGVLVLSGTADGADILGEKWAFSRMHPVERWHPEWMKYGAKKAPLRRNEEMVKHAHACVAFWDGESTGTMHCYNLARKAGLKTKLVKVGPESLIGYKPRKVKR